MNSTLHKTYVFAFVWTATSIATGCRNPQRHLAPGAGVGTVVVQLDNLELADRNQAGYIYQLGGCLPKVTGVLNAGVVSFSSEGIRNALAGCTLQIKTTQPLSGAKFAAGADQTLLYSAQLPDFYIDVNGGIAAIASLSKLYSTGDGPLPKTANPAVSGQDPGKAGGSSEVNITPRTGSH